MKHIKKIIFIGIVAILSLQSCRVAQTYKINEQFEVILEKEGIGGYEWNYMAIPEVVKIDSSKISIAEENSLVVYKRKFLLKGVKIGTYNIEFHHLRSFEKFDTIPEDYIKKIKIKIKK